MEDDADFLAVCLPGNKHNVCTCFPSNKRLSSVSKDINLYTDFSSFDGIGDT